MKKTLIVELISFLFIVLFLYTSISKLMEFTVFKHQIAASPVLSPVAWWIAWVIPAVEIIVSLMLLIPRLRLKGLYASLVLMIGFTAYIIIILNFSKTIPCSCGGVLEQLSWTEHIVFNSVFIVLAIAGILLQRGVIIQSYKYQ